MDPVTHALVGASVAGSLTDANKRRQAMLLGGVAALVPDLDVLLHKGTDPLFQLELHRQFSHALLTFGLVAVVMATVICRLARGRLAFGSTVVSLLLGLTSAGLLDACTSYGTQLLWPFSSQRLAWNIVPVFDPLFTVVLLGLVVVAWRSSRRLAVGLALGWLGLYLGHGTLQHHRAVTAMVSELAAQGGRPAEIVMKPTLGNQILWRATYIESNRIYCQAIHTGWNVALLGGESAPLYDPERELASQRGSRLYKDLRRFAALSEGYLVVHPERPDVVGDARYSMLANSLSPLWGLQVDWSQPETPPRFVTFRDASAAVRGQFWKQLKG